MRACVSLFQIDLAQSLQYRLAGVVSSVTGMFYGWVEIIIFHVFFLYGENFVTDMTLTQVVSYAWLHQILFGIHLLNINGEIFSYAGQLKDGKPHGRGTAIYPKNDKDGRARYEGPFSDGKREGKGILVYQDSTKYDGDFGNDTYNGRGTLTYSDGRFFSGNFLNGKKDGQGRYYDPKRCDTVISVVCRNDTLFVSQ